MTGEMLFEIKQNALTYTYEQLVNAYALTLGRYRA